MTTLAIECSTKEYNEAFSKISPNLVDVVVVLGFEESVVEALQDWLEESSLRTLVILEKDILKFNHWKQSSEYVRLKENSQVIVLYHDQSSDKQLMSYLSYRFLLQRIEVMPLSKYQNEGDYFEETHKKITLNICTFSYLGLEFWNYGEKFYSNFYKNTHAFSKSYDGQFHADSYKHLPCIICGAGPSLKKQIPFLKTLKNKALIIASGTAITILTKNGIVPHMGVALDPLEEELQRLSSHQGYEMPLFYSHRIYHKALSLFHGDLNYLSCDYWYQTMIYMEKKLGISSELRSKYSYGGGCSSVTIALLIAKAMGFHTMALCGVDLAYTDQKRYSDENLDVTHPHAREKQWKPLVETKDIEGKSITTRWEWMNESQWIEEFAKGCSEQRVINATEGGIGFLGVENMSLKNTNDLYFKKQFPIAELLHTHTQQAKFNISEKEVSIVMRGVKESLIKCLDFVDNLLINSKETEEQWKKTKELPLLIRTGSGILDDIDLQDELAYKIVLKPMEIVVEPVFERQVDNFIDEGFLSSKEKRWWKDLLVDRRRLYYLKEAIENNLSCYES
jgi:hypothetical protein